MTARHALKCGGECDFVIALQGHDFETIEKGLDAYDACPNCGSDLVEAYCYEPKMGFLKITGPVESQGDLNRTSTEDGE